MSIKLEELKYGEMVAVQVKAPKFYKARFLNYADYGHGKVFCVEVYREDGHNFVDFFREVFPYEEYVKTRSLQRKRNKTGRFFMRENGTISFVYDDGKGSLNDCQVLLSYADAIFGEVEGKRVRVDINLEEIGD